MTNSNYLISSEYSEITKEFIRWPNNIFNYYISDETVTGYLLENKIKTLNHPSACYQQNTNDSQYHKCYLTVHFPLPFYYPNIKEQIKSEQYYQPKWQSNETASALTHDNSGKRNHKKNCARDPNGKASGKQG